MTGVLAISVAALIFMGTIAFGYCLLGALRLAARILRQQDEME